MIAMPDAEPVTIDDASISTDCLECLNMKIAASQKCAMSRSQVTRRRAYAHNRCLFDVSVRTETGGSHYRGYGSQSCECLRLFVYVSEFLISVLKPIESVGAQAGEHPRTFARGLPAEYYMFGN